MSGAVLNHPLEMNSILSEWQSPSQKKNLIEMVLLWYFIQNSLFVTEGGISFFRLRTCSRDIFNTLFPGEIPSEKAYQRLEEQLYQLLSRTIATKQSNGKVHIVKLTDQFTMEPCRKKENRMENVFDIQFGQAVSAAILSYRLSLLQEPIGPDPAADIPEELYWSLYEERFRDLYLYGRREHLFTLIGMLLLFRVEAKSEAGIVRKYGNLLKKIKEKTSLIADYDVSHQQFLIMWTPLNIEEQKNFEIVKNKCSGAVP